MTEYIKILAPEVVPVGPTCTGCAELFPRGSDTRLCKLFGDIIKLNSTGLNFSKCESCLKACKLAQNS